MVKNTSLFKKQMQLTTYIENKFELSSNTLKIIHLLVDYKQVYIYPVSYYIALICYGILSIKLDS